MRSGAVAIAEQTKADLISIGNPDLWLHSVQRVLPEAAIMAGLITAGLTAAKLHLKAVIGGKKGLPSSSTPQTGTRTAKGLAEGGYMIQREQDGRMFDATYNPGKRGYVNGPTVIVGEGPKSREWVASNAAVSNPTIAPILDLLDRHQQAGTIRTLDLNRLLNAKAIGYG